jgi:hypothetical protein
MGQLDDINDGKGDDDERRDDGPDTAVVGTHPPPGGADDDIGTTAEAPVSTGPAPVGRGRPGPGVVLHWSGLGLRVPGVGFGVSTQPDIGQHAVTGVVGGNGTPFAGMDHGVLCMYVLFERGFWWPALGMVVHRVRLDLRE